MQSKLGFVTAAGVAVGIALAVAACDTGPAAPTAPGGDAAGTAAVAEARGGQAKVLVCHVTSEGEIVPKGGGSALGLTGHVIAVAEAALPAHCAHGDHEPNDEKSAGDSCQRRIDIETPNVECNGNVTVLPPWASEAGD